MWFANQPRRYTFFLDVRPPSPLVAPRWSRSAHHHQSKHCVHQHAGQGSCCQLQCQTISPCLSVMGGGDCKLFCNFQKNFMTQFLHFFCHFFQVIVFNGPLMAFLTQLGHRRVAKVRCKEGVGGVLPLSPLTSFFCIFTFTFLLPLGRLDSNSFFLAFGGPRMGKNRSEKGW